MKKYSDEIRDFITKNVKGMTTKELAKLVNDRFYTDFTESKMKSYKTNYNLKSETKKGNPKGYSDLYSPEIQQFIKNNISGKQIKDLTELINKIFNANYKQSQIRGYIKNHNLKSGLDFRIPLGHIPSNKGTKGLYNVGGNKTSFKKGDRPQNYRPIGSERINVDGYTEIKVADPGKWKLKHQVIWEEYNGPIPKKHVVIFGDKNKQNFDINNLILVSNKQLARLNQNHLIQNNADLTRTAVIIADLYSKISEKRKKQRRD